MVATLCLFSYVLAAAQTPELPVLPASPRAVPAAQTPPRSATVDDVLLNLHLDPAQELVYRGAFTELSTAGGVQSERSYRVETRVFVLNAAQRGAEVAILTVLKPRTAASRGPSSVRLEVVRLDDRANMTADEGVSLAAPVDGPPTVECGAFVPLPANRVGESQPWQVVEEGRPGRTWEIAGSEAVNGHSCLKLIGQQQSSDWEQPRGDRSAWKRKDTVWLSPRSGFAYRVERVIERREPGRTQVTQTGVLRYELETSMPYTRQLYEDCRQEIAQARACGDAARPLLAKADRFGPQLDTILARIKQHLDTSSPTPYREAVLQVQRQIEAAQRGEMPPPVVAAKYVETDQAPQKATVGGKAPDFAAPVFGEQHVAQFRLWRGRPLLMVFYQPTSVTAAELLRFAQGIQKESSDTVSVLGLAMSDDAQAVLKQRDALKVTFPLLNGTGLRQSYAIDATPTILVIDAGGVVRATYTGWGHEIPHAVTEELRRWLPPTAAPK